MKNLRVAYMPNPRNSPQDNPVKLSSEEELALREGIRSAEEDRKYTLEDALEMARSGRKAWKAAREQAA